MVDLAKGHLRALEYLGEHVGCEEINLGTGKGTSVLELVEKFQQVNQVSVPYEIDQRRPGDLAECYAAVEKAQHLLGWTAEKIVEDMCRDSWHWIKTGMNKPMGRKDQKKFNIRSGVSSTQKT